jgi:hypothetical protein
MSFPGITNINEFFTNYYFAEVFPSELKEHLAAIPTDASEKALMELRKNWIRDFNSFSLASTDSEERALLADSLSTRILSALGFTPSPQTLPAGNLAGGLSTWASLPAGQSLPSLHIFSFPLIPDFDPAENELLNLPIAPGDSTLWAEYLASTLFPSAHAPRWVMLVYPSQWILLDRSRFAAQRYLRFDWQEIFDKHDIKSYRAALTLLHPSALIPTTARPIHDSLEESSHKNAAAASENLKYAVREAIELLGNEVIYFRRQQKLNIYDDIKPEDLSRECLRWLYRLLFLFYVESRKESLQLLDQQGDDFHLAYTLEGLRPLAESDLHSEESRNGHFLDESLGRLCDLIYRGFESNITTKVDDNSFRRPALPADLFDPKRTPILSRTRLRNSTLQEILRLLSLDSPKGSKRKHRISYHSLGINQLGSVYEGLLSYTGQFAKEDLYEVRPAPGKAKPKAGDDSEEDADPNSTKASAEDDPLAQVWFVNKAALAQYKPAEIVSRNGRPIVHPQGTFLYRLASRNRQKSASYYTPEILTACLVKYTLKPLLEGKSADDILQLTICEPALGSGAFLNEAINQLTDAYIERKHREIGGELPSQKERQKIKAFLADNRVFGVDLNPIAIELAEISLWLNSLYPEQTIPYFGSQLFAGNSLVGARRQVYSKAQLLDERRWQDAVPDRVPLGQPLAEGAVWHFLVPNDEMAAYNPKVVKALYPEDSKRLKDWSTEFNRKLSQDDYRSLIRLSAAADRLWLAHAQSLADLRDRTSNIFPIYGQNFEARNHQLTVGQREKILSDGLSGNSPYRRLKVALDYWCSLWFWPIEESRNLPTRDQFWSDLLAILEGDGAEVRPLRPEQKGLSFDPAHRRPVQGTLAADFEASLGEVDLQKLIEDSTRLKVVQRLTSRQRFFHWELEFADLFLAHGGFHLTLGNPPWIRLEFSETDVIGDFDPLPVIRDISAPEVARGRAQYFAENPGLEQAYREEFVSLIGLQNFLNAYQNYPHLVGTPTNTFKCFVTNSWFYGSPVGAQGLVHPEGAYDDPEGKQLRNALYPRLRYHFQFQNELRLFPEVHHETLFSLNVYGSPRTVQFITIANLFHPIAIDSSVDADPSDLPCDGIKTDFNKWNVSGHTERALLISETELGLFARLYDAPGTPPLAARLPALHSSTLLSVLEKLAGYPHRLANIESGYFPISHWWNEKTAVDARSIRRETRFPTSPSEWILSGPHIFVSNPCFKTPRAVSKKNGDYDLLDLSTLPSDYLPRTNYLPDTDESTYLSRTPKVLWGSEQPVTKFFRFICRRQLSQSGERTFMPTILPPGPAHLNTISSIAFENPKELIHFLSLSISLIVDFYVKSTGKGDAYSDFFHQLPTAVATNMKLHVRTLMLNCLTSYYAALWEQCFNPSFTQNRWAKRDHRLLDANFSSLTEAWTRSTPIRSSFARRQAVLEVDVLAAQALGLDLQELLTIYRIQFPVFRGYERNTFYDQTGKIVYLAGDNSYGVSTPEWKKIRDTRSGIVHREVIDSTQPNGAVSKIIDYHAPFECMDREADYAEAWAFFEDQAK